MDTDVPSRFLEHLIILVFILIAVLIGFLIFFTKRHEEPGGYIQKFNIELYLADGTLVSGSDVIDAIDKCSETQTVIEVITCAGNTSAYNWDGIKKIPGYTCTDRNAPEYINLSAVFMVEAAEGKVTLTQQKGTTE